MAWARADSGDVLQHDVRPVSGLRLLQTLPEGSMTMDERPYQSSIRHFLEAKEKPLDRQTELCVRMLQHSAFASHMDNKRPSEVKEALKFFFADEVIQQAVSFVTGRPLPVSATSPTTTEKP